MGELFPDYADLLDSDMVVVVNAWNEDGSTRGPRLFDVVVKAVKR